MKKFSAILAGAAATIGLGVLLTSCNKEEDTTPPQKVSNLTAEPANQAVILRWTNANNKNIKHFEVAYADKSLIATADGNTARIDNLQNGEEYTFAVTAVGTNGVKSDAIEVKAKPDKYVTTVEGKEFVSGTYLYSDMFPIEMVINNSNYKRTMTAGGGNVKYVWEGTISKLNDTTYKFAHEYYTEDRRGREHVADIVDYHSSAMCFSSLKGDSTYYADNLCEKIEGDTKFLPGKYRRYLKSTSTDWIGVNDTIYYYIDIDSEGNMSYYDTGGFSTVEHESWTNEDLLKGNYFFVSMNSRIYIVEMRNRRLYAKKN